jgi:hypothetical protein
MALYRGLRDHWGPHEENTARLLEVRSYALDLTWADRTIDPNDPEVIRERRAARHRKPPPHPIIPPIALRPPWAADERMRDYTAALEAHQPSTAPRTVTLDEWDRAAGLI